MNLKTNSKDHNLVEDEMGNPIFNFLGLHPSDRDEIIRLVNSGDQVKYLKAELEEAEEKLDRIMDII